MSGTLAFYGEAYVRRGLRDTLEARIGRPFVAVDGSPRTFDSRVSLLDTSGGIGASAPARFVDIGELNEIPPAERSMLLSPLDIDTLLIVGPTYFTDGLTAARRAGIPRVLGAVLRGTRTPESADDEECHQNRLAFVAYASMCGWYVCSTHIIDLSPRGSDSGLEPVLRAWNERRDITVVARRPRHAFACATCGVNVVGSVAPTGVRDLEELWSTDARTPGDESLAPLGHYFRGDGASSIRGWLLEMDTLYFHQADWLGTDENGQGAKVTCCGYRPAEGRGYNLSCANGHALGYVWTDCCAPQGLHVPLQNLVRREE